MRLRTSLFLLSLATALPLVAFALLAAAFVVQHENENLLSVAKARNRAIMSAIDAELRGTIGALRAITVVRSLTSDDLHTFHATAREILATQPSWNNVLLHDPQGRQLVDASLPWGAPLLERMARSVRRVFHGQSVWATETKVDALYEENLRQHRALREAIAAGSAKGARILASEHVLSSGRLLEAILDELDARRGNADLGSETDGDRASER